MKRLGTSGGDHPLPSEIDQMTPWRPDFDGKAYDEIKEKIADLIAQSAALSQKVTGPSARYLERLSIGISCFYTNIMEGNITTPLEIERALKSAQSSAGKDVKEIVRAHINASLWAQDEPLDVQHGLADWMCQAHAKLHTSDLHEHCKPGKLRDYQVEVGEHVAVDHECLSTFLEQLSKIYNPTNPKALLSRVIDALCMPHRLMWIHPFGDGNGRVGRVVLQNGLEQVLPGAKLWSLSRGYARDDRGAFYKSWIQNTDSPRQGDYDGRGNLSSRMLAGFVSYSVDRCVDQVQFMSNALDLDGIEQRAQLIFSLIDKPQNAARMTNLFTQCMAKGQCTRGELVRSTGLAERTARNILSDMLRLRFLASDSEKGLVYAAFPVPALGYLLPNLYPQAPLPSFSRQALEASAGRGPLGNVRDAAL